MAICRALYRYRTLSIIAGAVIGAASFYMPFSLFIMLIAALIFVYAVMRDYRIGVYSAIALMSVVPHVLWNNIYVVAIIFVSFASYLLFAAKNQKTLEIKTIDFALILFMITVVIGFVTSAIPIASAKVFLFFLCAFAFTILIIQMVKDKKQLERLLITILLLSSAASLYGIWQAIIGVEVDLAQIDININQGMPGRIFSTMENSNNFAQYLLLVIPVGICLMFNAHGLLRKSVFGALTLLPAACLGLTYSRSAWIGFAAALGLLLLLKNRKLIPLYIVAGCIGFMLLPQSILNRIYTIGNFRDTSIMYRVYIWSGALRMLKQHWLNGIGIGAEVFSVVYSNFRDVKVTNATHAHMLLLEIWIELGIVGMLSFAWMVGRAIKKALLHIFVARDPYFNNILIAMIASVVGLMGAGAFEYAWFYPRIFFFFWVIIGIMFSALNLADKSEILEQNVKA